MKRLLALAIPHVLSFRIPAWLKIASKWGFSFAILAYLWHYLQQFSATGFELPFESLWSVSFVLVLALVPLNWGLESYKWGVLLNASGIDTDWSTLTGSVLTGIAAGLITPNRTGEYIGRLAVVPTEKRIEAGGLLIFDRWGQMLATLLGGACAWSWFGWHHYTGLPFSVALVIGSAWSLAIVGGALLLFVKRFPGNKLWERLHLKAAVDAFTRLGFSLRVQLLLLSCLRYVVFTLQFAVIMLLLGFEGGLLAASSLAGVVFWVKSFVPSLALAELGVRESIAIFIGVWFHLRPEIAAISAFLLFLINLVLPAVVGLFLWMKSE